MIHPLSINLFEQNNTFQLTGDAFAQIFLTFCIQCTDFFLNFVAQLFLVDLLEVIAGDLQNIACNHTDKVVAETFHIPVFRFHTFRHVHLHCRINGFIHHGQDGILEVFTIQNLVALCIDDFTLFVHNIVELQYVLTNTKVVILNLLLCFLDRLADRLMLDFFSFWNSQCIVYTDHSFRSKQSHQIIFQ